MKAYKYDENKYYAGQQECQLDPIATKREGHHEYGMPIAR